VIRFIGRWLAVSIVVTFGLGRWFSSLDARG
jgi:hypothetical protein